MDEPRPGKTTFVIMVSPLPGKYELLGPLRHAPLRAPRSLHTVTSCPPPPHGGSPRHPGRDLAHPQHALGRLSLAPRGTVGPGPWGPGSPCAPAHLHTPRPLTLPPPPLWETGCLEGWMEGWAARSWDLDGGPWKPGLHL
ncbi:hypothetical protein VULLAG_LOCUS15194 [Vulpes lagopus]